MNEPQNITPNTGFPVQNTQPHKISWDDVLNDNFVMFNDGEPKQLIITNWRFEMTDKYNKPQIEFVADVLTENQESVQKLLTTTSKRFIKALRPILEPKQPTAKVKIIVIKIGEKFETQYSVKEQQ